MMAKRSGIMDGIRARPDIPDITDVLDSDVVGATLASQPDCKGKAVVGQVISTGY
jgi:hypothetical protein